MPARLENTAGRCQQAQPALRLGAGQVAGAGGTGWIRAACLPHLRRRAAPQASQRSSSGSTRRGVDESAGTPGPVSPHHCWRCGEGGHPSRTAVASRLQRPTRTPRASSPRPCAVWSCSRWGLPSRASHLARWWSLTPPFHPDHRSPGGGLLSVALSRGSPRVAVSHHRALWSPDVPRRVTARWAVLDAAAWPTHPRCQSTRAHAPCGSHASGDCRRSSTQRPAPGIRSKAAATSATRSSVSSIPTESRMTLSGTSRSVPRTDACVICAG